MSCAGDGRCSMAWQSCWLIWSWRVDPSRVRLMKRLKRSSSGPAARGVGRNRQSERGCRGDIYQMNREQQQPKADAAQNLSSLVIPAAQRVIYRDETARVPPASGALCSTFRHGCATMSQCWGLSWCWTRRKATLSCVRDKAMTTTPWISYAPGGAGRCRFRSACYWRFAQETGRVRRRRRPGYAKDQACVDA